MGTDHDANDLHLAQITDFLDRRPEIESDILIVEQNVCNFRYTRFLMCMVGTLNKVSQVITDKTIAIVLEWGAHQGKQEHSVARLCRKYGVLSV